VNSEIAMIFHRSPGKKNTRVYVRRRPRALIGLVISGPRGWWNAGAPPPPDETRRLAKVTFEYERRQYSPSDNGVLSARARILAAACQGR
jgi:hypothetical protein